MYQPLHSRIRVALTFMKKYFSCRLSSFNKKSLYRSRTYCGAFLSTYKLAVICPIELLQYQSPLMLGMEYATFPSNMPLRLFIPHLFHSQIHMKFTSWSFSLIRRSELNIDIAWKWGDVDDSNYLITMRNKCADKIMEADERNPSKFG